MFDILETFFKDTLQKYPLTRFSEKSFPPSPFPPLPLPEKMADVEDFSSKNDADMIGAISLIFWQKHIVLIPIFYQKIGKNGQERIAIFSFFLILS